LCPLLDGKFVGFERLTIVKPDIRRADVGDALSILAISRRLGVVAIFSSARRSALPIAYLADAIW